LKWFHWIAISLLVIGTIVDQSTTQGGFIFGHETNPLVINLIELTSQINVFEYGAFVFNQTPFLMWTLFNSFVLVSIILPYLYLHKRRYFGIAFFSFSLTLGSYRLYAGVNNISLMVKDAWVS